MSFEPQKYFAHESAIIDDGCLIGEAMKAMNNSK
jgi:hypothetical protein